MDNNKIVPLYQQIKEDIKGAIENYKYKPQQKIPNEMELSKEYSVSRITIRRAIEELCNDGYLIKKQGLGTFVSTPRIHRKMKGEISIESFTKTCEKQGVTAGAKVLQCQIVPAREDEMEFFNISSEKLLIYVERIRTADDNIIFLENIILTYDEFKDILNMNLEDISIFECVESISGRSVMSTNKRSIEISLASSLQAKKMKVPVSEPLLFMNSHVVDDEGIPLFIGRQYYIGKRYMFEL